MRNALRDYRTDVGLSQADLADHVGVTRQTINAVERGRYDPSVELVFKLAAFFECRVEDLFQPAVELDETVSDV
jgi:putative transcriptional regulator